MEEKSQLPNISMGKFIINVHYNFKDTTKSHDFEKRFHEGISQQKGFLFRYAGQEENGSWTSVTGFETKENFQDAVKNLEDLFKEGASLTKDNVPHYFEF